VVILTAVALEARAIAAAWGSPGPKPGRPIHLVDRALTIEIHLVGIRAVRMPGELGNSPVAGMIMAGLAGALDPSLKVGDIVIDDCPADWLPNVPYRVGKIVCADALVTTPGAKKSLHDTTGALAVDMESEKARGMALEVGVPFVSIRAISDAASDALDPAVLHLVDEFGHARPLSIAGALLRRPGLIPQLRQLGRDSKLAAENLAGAVRAIVSRIE
jgi:hypothetical protein